MWNGLEYKPMPGGRTGSYVYNPSGWSVLVKVTAICPDDKIRMVRVTSQPDTYFSIRGRTSIYGIPVSGVVTEKDGENVFTVYTKCKNYDKYFVELILRGTE